MILREIASVLLLIFGATFIVTGITFLLVGFLWGTKKKRGLISLIIGVIMIIILFCVTPPELKEKFLQQFKQQSPSAELQPVTRQIFSILNNYFL